MYTRRRLWHMYYGRGVYLRTMTGLDRHRPQVHTMSEIGYFPWWINDEFITPPFIQ